MTKFPSPASIQLLRVILYKGGACSTNEIAAITGRWHTNLWTQLMRLRDDKLVTVKRTRKPIPLVSRRQWKFTYLNIWRLTDAGIAVAKLARELGIGRVEVDRAQPHPQII